MKYRFVGDHVDQLEDGTELVPGDFVDLLKDQLKLDRAEELISTDKLIGVDKKAEDEAVNAKRRYSTRENREQQQADEVQEEGEVSVNA